MKLPILSAALVLLSLSSASAETFHLMTCKSTGKNLNALEAVEILVTTDGKGSSYIHSSRSFEYLMVNVNGEAKAINILQTESRPQHWQTAYYTHNKELSSHRIDLLFSNMKDPDYSKGNDRLNYHPINFNTAEIFEGGVRTAVCTALK